MRAGRSRILGLIASRTAVVVDLARADYAAALPGGGAQPVTYDGCEAALPRAADEPLMPKRTDISSILIIGAGPIVIGQAAEFDYSGTQAAKALSEEGYRIVLVNSNPATIMTDPDLADATYVEPITPEYVAAIIAKERPDAVLPTMGGQTALNTALALVQGRHAGQIWRPHDRRRRRGDRDGRGPAEVPPGDGPDRARKPALGDRPLDR